MTKLAGALEEADGGAGIPFIRIDGSTDSRDRLLVGVPQRFVMSDFTVGFLLSSCSRAVVVLRIGVML